MSKKRNSITNVYSNLKKIKKQHDAKKYDQPSIIINKSDDCSFDFELKPASYDNTPCPQRLIATAISKTNEIIPIKCIWQRQTS